MTTIGTRYSTRMGGTEDTASKTFEDQRRFMDVVLAPKCDDSEAITGAFGEIYKGYASSELSLLCSEKTLPCAMKKRKIAAVRPKVLK